ncbi:MAG: phosphoenolpyruvate--protein phosphotransferase [Planctomycetes bacterium]|nr:phosphoenolpyruvate--protein phosphotransferase [Planctomycetota bacterium]
MSQRARIIHGTAVSPGLAVGPVHVARTQAQRVTTWSVREEDVAREVERLGQAIQTAIDEMVRRQRLVAAQASEKDAEIFAVHRMVLQDPGALKQVESVIRDQRVNAEAGVQALIQRLQASLGKLEGDSVRAYAADIADPWRVVLDTLLAVERAEFLSSESRIVLAASELTPEAVTYLERGRLLAVIAETGGRFSHAAVLARAFGIPCVVGLPGLIGRLERGMPIAVDGDHGTVQLAPSPADVRAFELRAESRAARQESLRVQANLPAESTDGRRLGVLVNLESLRDLDMFRADHTDGLGLVRTEFLYMERPQFPSEDEQFRLYRRVVERMTGLPVTLRTLDIGGDKQLSYFKTPRETNPALGWRGIRISLEWQDLLRVQLRAALRAGTGHDLRLLLPMVASVEDVTLAKSILEGVRQALAEQGYDQVSEVPLGMMIEVPSVLFTLPEMLKHVDFVSVGTNDLVQYLLAVDRDNPWVAKLYEPQHPAVMTALELVARTCRQAGKPSSVCGDLASDPALAVLLFGMGFDSVSVAPNFVPGIKYAVRKIAHAEAREMALEAVAAQDCAGVKRVVARCRERIA